MNETQKRLPLDQPEAIADEPALSGVSIVKAKGDPEQMLQILETQASLVVRWERAIQQILVTCTYPEDWTEFGEGKKAKMCLSSAGAERVGKHFPIQFHNADGIKEDWSDKHGKAYRFIYDGYATLHDNRVYAEGSYSTRDKFLGKAHDEFRPIEDINESDIRNAARHIFCGNAIKALLGLRALPKAQFERICKQMGLDESKAGKATFAAGTKGGTSEEEAVKQAELGNLLVQMANSNMVITIDENKDGKKVLIEEHRGVPPVEMAKESCELLTAYTTGTGKFVPGKRSARQVKGKQLDVCLSIAKKLWEEYTANKENANGKIGRCDT